MFPCLMARNEIPRPLEGGLKSLTRVLSLPSSSASDLALLLLPRPSSLQGRSVFPSHHLHPNAVLHSVNLPSDPRFFVRGHPLRPGARPVVGALPLVAAEVPCGHHRVASPLTPIVHMRSARRFLAHRNVSVPCE